MLPFGSGVGSFDDPKLLFERRHAEKNLRPTLEESRRLQEASAVAEAGLEGEIVNACHSGSSFERSLQGMWGDARAPLSCLQLDCTQFIRKMQP